jgi:hypothetical protein
VRSLVVYNMIKASLQVIEQWLSQSGVVLVIYLFLENVIIARFLDVCGGRQYHP